MAFKLTVQEKKRRDELIAQHKETAELLAVAVHEANEAIETAIGNANAAVEKHNEAISALNAFVEEKAGDFREEFDNKSENWREGERSSAVDDFIGEWENLDEIEKIEEFDELKLEEPETAEDPLEGLPEGVEE